MYSYLLLASLLYLFILMVIVNKKRKGAAQVRPRTMPRHINVNLTNSILALNPTK